jgi:hypothetical protein
MFIDSHCHLNFPELADNLADVLAKMKLNEVTHALCVSVDLNKFPQILQLAEHHSNIYASVGVHPDYELAVEPTQPDWCALPNIPKSSPLAKLAWTIIVYRVTWNGSVNVSASIFVLHVNVASRLLFILGQRRLIHYD